MFFNLPQSIRMTPVKGSLGVSTGVTIGVSCRSPNILGKVSGIFGV